MSLRCPFLCLAVAICLIAFSSAAKSFGDKNRHRSGWQKSSPYDKRYEDYNRRDHNGNHDIRSRRGGYENRNYNNKSNQAKYDSKDRYLNDERLETLHNFNDRKIATNDNGKLRKLFKQMATYLVAVEIEKIQQYKQLVTHTSGPLTFEEKQYAINEAAQFVEVHSQGRRLGVAVRNIKVDDINRRPELFEYHVPNFSRNSYDISGSFNESTRRRSHNQYGGRSRKY